MHRPVYVVRHPQPDIASGTCYGQLDVAAKSLDLIRCQEVLKERFAGQPVQVFSSPLQRCVTLAEHLNPAPEIVPDLQEMHFGRWEGRRWTDIPHSEVNAWRDDFLHTSAPGGESVQQFYNRVTACIEGVHWSTTATNVVISHAGVIRCLYAWSGQHALENAQHIDIAFGSVHEFTLYIKS